MLWSSSHGLTLDLTDLPVTCLIFVPGFRFVIASSLLPSVLSHIIDCLIFYQADNMVLWRNGGTRRKISRKNDLMAAAPVDPTNAGKFGVELVLSLESSPSCCGELG